MKIPPSKSHTMRALLFEHLSKKECIIENTLQAPEVEDFKKNLRIWGDLDAVDVRNSGLALHFYMALASLRGKKTVITGDASIRTLRPVAPLVEALRSLGVKITYLENVGFAPLEIEGPVHPGSVELDGTNSQHVSALLIALSQCEGKSTIHVKNPCEKPYVEITLGWLNRFQANIENCNYETFHIPKKVMIDPFQKTIPMDFSSLAFLVAVSKILNTELDLEKCDFSDAQGDKALFSLLKQSECSIEDTPDLLPILMVLALYGKGPTKLHKIHVARQKESDRPFSMRNELVKMGACIRINEAADWIEITPGPLKGAPLFSHNDHRVAMSLAVAAIGATGTTTIESVHCVSKSFPSFFETFCPDWAAEIGKDDFGKIVIRPKKPEFCRS